MTDPAKEARELPWSHLYASAVASDAVTVHGATAQTLIGELWTALRDLAKAREERDGYKSKACSLAETVRDIAVRGLLLPDPWDDSAPDPTAGWLADSPLGDDVVALRERIAAIDANAKGDFDLTPYIGQEVVVDHPRYHGIGILSRVDAPRKSFAWVRLSHGEDRCYEAATVLPIPPPPPEAGDGN